MENGNGTKFKKSIRIRGSQLDQSQSCQCHDQFSDDFHLNLGNNGFLTREVGFSR